MQTEEQIQLYHYELFSTLFKKMHENIKFFFMFGLLIFHSLASPQS